ncbi:hypothetical protein FGG08_005362 [Glutinoglossum americanum]|uniref:Xaa-Pro aminopeptidase n=1 Tax=Glutinoglossum americanum TaxID=1670608 RepID=A0A9P8HYJ9_9PEZI|nr:hypothetical protein FGG08_005362 [Glutinoglossum americanum]
MRSSLCACRHLREFRLWNALRAGPNRLSSVPARSYASISAADLKFGQPLHETHAHILAAGERIPVTPGISALEYATRRAKLAAHLPDNAIAVLASSNIKYRSGTVFYEFHQDPDFFYLTGTSLPHSALEGGNVLSTLSESYPDSSRKPGWLLEVLGAGKTMPLKPVLNELRVFKSPAEVGNMRLAGKFSGRSFTNVMRRNFTKEKDLRAVLECEFRLRGCDNSAYVPVVAGGENALSIHYVRNDDILRGGDLVLVDAGGEYGGYITDITRTWPVNGKFSPAQKDLYQAILDVQRTCVALCRENASVSLDKLHDIAEHGLEDQLKQLGFDLSGRALETLFPHHVGHYIGLDVHDSPGYPRTGELKAGQCITIEP